MNFLIYQSWILIKASSFKVFIFHSNSVRFCLSFSVRVAILSPQNTLFSRHDFSLYDVILLLLLFYLRAAAAVASTTDQPTNGQQQQQRLSITLKPRKRSARFLDWNTPRKHHREKKLVKIIPTICNLKKLGKTGAKLLKMFEIRLSLTWWRIVLERHAHTGGTGR